MVFTGEFKVTKKCVSVTKSVDLRSLYGNSARDSEQSLVRI